MILNSLYKEIINIGHLFFSRINCAWLTTQALDYIYLLLKNAFWTKFPNCVDEDESTSTSGCGRPSSTYYTAVYQSAGFIYFMAYVNTTSSRSDAYSVNQFEWTTTMGDRILPVGESVHRGIDTRAWTSWIVFAVFTGLALIFFFAPIYASLSHTFNW
ncbi:hypothetical protein A4X13_0g8829 [Tilletia indica]|uniref:Uncharacterized protein n=1 Tax=Tilletia indica TaxID=43049 RepID=A0A177T002_9BASI|nr:hypothetical protein A4X13_0g8829 [Tilletia indica]